MTKVFEGPMALLEFSEFIIGTVAAEGIATQAAIEAAAKLLQKAAKAKIGDPTSLGLGGSPWPPLADVTQAERVDLGFSADESLLRTGELRDSIKWVRERDEACVGSDLDIAVYQEMGTGGNSRGGPIPPRSFLGSAAQENAHKVRDLIGEAAMIALTGTYRGIRIP